MLSSVILIDLVTRMLGVVRALINPKLLGAEVYGRVGVLSAILQFAGFCDLGLCRDFELSFPRARDSRQAIGSALRSMTLRMLAPIVLIAALLARIFDPEVSAAATPYFAAFCFAELLLVVLRAEKREWVINVYAVGSALAYTVGVIWVAPYGVQGIALLQSAVCVAGAAGLFFYRLRFGSETSRGMTAHLDPVEHSLALWLFLGQLPALAWLTLDRFLLLGRISAADMGYWALGALPGGVLAGIAATGASLHMAAWVRKERRFILPIEAAFYAFISLVGYFVYGPFVERFLPNYSAGLSWNHRLMIAHMGLGILFFYDGYRRSFISNASGALEWLLVKAGLTLAAFAIAVTATFLLGFDPRIGVIGGFHLMLVALWIYERRWEFLLMQFALAGMTALIQ